MNCFKLIIKILLVLSLILGQDSYAKKRRIKNVRKYKKTRIATKEEVRSILFFKENQKSENSSRFQFNSYENLVSGVAAFVIGNAGYFTTDNSVLKLVYTGIQTIGIINIGQGIYKRNSPQFKRSFYGLLTKDKSLYYHKNRLSNDIIKIFAQDDRAKRLSRFYSSSFLASQYFINLALDKPDKKIRNIYIFLGAVNSIAAFYYGLNKSEYENFHYGEGLDLNPLAFFDEVNKTTFGFSLSYKF